MDAKKLAVKTYKNEKPGFWQRRRIKRAIKKAVNAGVYKATFSKFPVSERDLLWLERQGFVRGEESNGDIFVTWITPDRERETEAKEIFGNMVRRYTMRGARIGKFKLDELNDDALRCITCVMLQVAKGRMNEVPKFDTVQELDDALSDFWKMWAKQADAERGKR
jgi:hypothetical protein